MFYNLSLFDSQSVFTKYKIDNVYPTTISLLHVVYDNRIWPSFIDSSNDAVSEKILIGSLSISQSKNSYYKYLFIDDTVTVVTYRHKTLQNVLTEIAGLLVLLRIFTLILGVFHE